MNKLADAILAATRDGIDIRFRHDADGKTLHVIAMGHNDKAHSDIWLNYLSLSFEADAAITAAVQLCHKNISSIRESKAAEGSEGKID